MARPSVSVRIQIVLSSMTITGVVVIAFSMISLAVSRKLLFDSVDHDLTIQANQTPPPVVYDLDSLPSLTAPEGPLSYGSAPHPPGEPTPFGLMFFMDPQYPEPKPSSFPPQVKMGGLVTAVLSLRAKSADSKIVGNTTLATLAVGGTRYRVLVRQLKDGLVEVVSYPMEGLYRLLDVLRMSLIVMLPIAMLATIVSSVLTARRVLQPVEQLNRAAERANAEDLSDRLPVVGNDEFSRLAKTLNSMFDRLEQSFVRLESALSQQKRFVADASHELRTPLTVIQGGTSWALLKERSGVQYREIMGQAHSAAARMERLIGDLLQLAKADAARLTPRISRFAIKEAFGPIFAHVASLESPPDVTTEVKPKELCLTADIDWLAEILMNLVENAVRYTPPTGSITLYARSTDTHVEVGVSDTGSGISSQHLPHVCERFYRVDAARSHASGGTGLGLAICKELAEAMGGELKITSVLGKGTDVTVQFPLEGQIIVL